MTIDAKTANRTPYAAVAAVQEEIARLKRCISMAMGCLDPESPHNPDERLAWYRLHDAMQGREPRSQL